LYKLARGCEKNVLREASYLSEDLLPRGELHRQPGTGDDAFQMIMTPRLPCRSVLHSTPRYAL